MSRLPEVEIERCWSKKCRTKKTRWIAGRGGKFSRCEECGDRFPCARACDHIDCVEARKKLGTDKAEPVQEGAVP